MISIEDVLDPAPTFTLSVYSFEVAEASYTVRRVAHAICLAEYT